MKVLMTADAVGGVWSYALELSRALRKHGAQISLAVMGGPLGEDRRSDASGIENLTIHEAEYRLEWMPEPWHDVRKAGKWLLGLERWIQPDLVHLNSFCHGQLCWRVPTLMVAHSEVSSWFRHVRGITPPHEWARYRREVAEGLRGAGMIVAPSTAALGDIQSEYGPFARTRMIPNGAEAPIPETQGPLKEEFVLSVGRLWDDAKNIRALDEAAPFLDWPVLAAGSVALERPNGALPEQATFKSVRALGELTRDRLSSYFARASIYALPARYEPFGLSVLEAALFRCALVLGDIPSLRENWDGAALFVDPENPAELQDVLQRLIHSGDERRRLSEAAFERAGKFTASAMADAYWELYRKLIAREAVA